jgi:glycosyltransferase involved in cell wall biosynthesis
VLRSQKYELLFRYYMNVNENNLCAPPHMVVVVVTVFEPWTPFLVEQLQSISNQTFMDFICVVAFDGPIDQRVLNECTFFSSEGKFRFLGYGERVGLYRHIERLFAEFNSLGKYIAFCDQDDVWLSDRLEAQVIALEQTGCDLVTNNAILIDSNSQPMAGSLFRTLGIKRESQRYVLTTNFATGSGSLYRSELATVAIPFPKDVGSAIHDHWLAALATIRNGVIISEKQSWCYRQHERNLIGAFRGKSENSRLLAVFSKLAEIIFERKPHIDMQIAMNVYILKTRFGEISDQIVDPIIQRSFLKRLQFFLPKALMLSRLDSIRIVKNDIRRCFIHLSGFENV